MVEKVEEEEEEQAEEDQEEKRRARRRLEKKKKEKKEVGCKGCDNHSPAERGFFALTYFFPILEKKFFPLCAA